MPKAASLELRIPPVAVVLLCAGVMVAMERVLPTAVMLSQIEAPLGLLAGFLAATGIVVAILGALAFRRAGTTVDPRYPDRASQLVVSGVYRVTRNPMYLGMLLCLAALAVYLRSPSAGLLLPLFVAYMNRFQIRAEERAMRDRFGAIYERYAASVRRWI
jgi:protein-S-isoprenylcysteine O-methyltransferase Ste14